ncbi:transglycosylase domain-containing protein [Pseudocalidococcus azoricus]|nr:penicillin-binding protein 1A [Pseudocalidococcus azoricus]
MPTNTISPKSQTSPALRGFSHSVLQVAGQTALLVAMVGSAVVAGGLLGLAISFRNLPDVRSLRGYIPSETTHIYDVNGTLLLSLHDEENREVVPLNAISPHLIRAVIAFEDSHFYQHHGINPVGIGRALVTNLTAGRTMEGGSTLTMQLVKNLFLTPERALGRKVSEAVLALRLEQIFDKQQILEMYLNQVYWGHNTYGVQTAARSYFNKPASDLTLAEAAMMAGIIQAPEAFSPFVDFQTAKQRQGLVLERMQELGWITAQEAATARQQEIKLGEITSFSGSRSPYITDTVMQELSQRFGREAVIKGGMRVQTTFDLKTQEIAEKVVKNAAKRLAGVRAEQMALVAVDPRTHYIKAVVGGVDYQKSQFNRATQAMRQPGSAFKPFVYYQAFASGRYTPDSSITDSPVTYRDSGEVYSPQNYDRSFSGSMSIRAALASSRNIPAVVLGQQVGINKVIETCRILGIKSPMLPVISLPLGAVDLTPLEITSAYATFANNGWQSETTSIVQITDNTGHLLLDNTPRPKLVLDPWAAAALNSAMQSVITSGTGTGAAIGRPAAGKTGTTSSERDIWFVGYVPQLATAVWAGNDNYAPLGKGATGGGMMAPIWREFMSQALKGVPVKSFTSMSEFTRPKPNK